MSALPRFLRLGRALAAGVLLAASAAPLAGQQPADPATEAATRAISQLRSPYCPGLMLEVCPSPQAVLLRDSIHDLAAQGMSAEQLVEWMIARHGEEWRGVPEQRGRGLWAWLIPPLALLGGMAAVAFWLRRGRSEAAPPPDAVGLSEAERSRVSAALRELERSGEMDR